MGRRDRQDREEIEREAAEELRRVAQQAGVPPPERPGAGVPPPPPGRPAPTSGYKPRGHLGAPGSATPSPPPPPPSSPPRRPTPSPPPPPPPPRRPTPSSRTSAPPPPPSSPPPPPSYDRTRWTPRSQEEPLPKLSPEEEEEALIEMALHDWATQSGRSVNPEDLVIQRVDPASVEAQRDRALQAEVERQRRFSQYRQRNPGHQVPQQQRHGAGEPSLWVGRPSGPGPFIPGLSPDLDQAASRHAQPGSAAAGSPAKKAAPAKKAGSKKAATAKKATATKAGSKKAATAKKAAPAKKASGKKAATAKKATPAKKVAAKKAAAKKAPGRGRS